ncbi:unnamed protein product [Caenorhabditis angaria]|uniref:C2 NT-type domain-containing protein n=1 Tax=Caenorhabditis angaria TaxID=860376 RepID=A0A9P1J1N3_9PELO|nr:unnamed protein product [Caenorhabditis angaria]
MRVRLVFVPWLWNKMAFMKRKTVKFSVDIQICHLSDVPLVNAVVFAKLRLLDGGSFEDTTERVEVKNHSASFNTRSEFSCRIPCDQTSGTLEKCLCRVSIRKEQKGGKSFYKLGYVDINLSEFAASGIEGISRTYLLSGYTSNQRLDNSKVCVKVVMCHQSADPFFRVPRLSNVGIGEEISLNPEAFKALDAIDSDSEEVSIQPKASIIDVQDCVSVPSSSAVDEIVTERKGISNSHQMTAVQLRRFSQDRSAQRIQNTRFDADNVIDKIIAECRLSEEGTTTPDYHGLSLEKFLDKNGKPLIGKQIIKRSSDQFKED